MGDDAGIGYICTAKNYLNGYWEKHPDYGNRQSDR